MYKRLLRLSSAAALLATLAITIASQHHVAMFFYTSPYALIAGSPGISLVYTHENTSLKIALSHGFQTLHDLLTLPSTETWTPPGATKPVTSYNLPWWIIILTALSATLLTYRLTRPKIPAKPFSIEGSSLQTPTPEEKTPPPQLS